MSQSKPSKPSSLTKDIRNVFGRLQQIFRLPRLTLKEVKALVEVVEDAATGEPQNDNDYIMERAIQFAARQPDNSRYGMAVTDASLKLLWNDLQHPPTLYIGDEFVYRTADGSNNNVLLPHLGAAGSSYARSVQPQTEDFYSASNQDLDTLFYLASIITHDIFRTDPCDNTRSLTSSYLDLAPLYGSNQDEQNAMRTFKDGKLKADCFSSLRILGFPPGVGVLLIMFNRFHNYVVENLALINEGGRFTKPDESDKAAYAKYDNKLFQTGRLVTCGLYVNIILKDYVRTILNLNRTKSPWALDPRTDMGAAKATGNQVSAEFNLLYRWHACISERDAKWTEDLYTKMFPNVEPSQITVPQFVEGLVRWMKLVPADPQDRPFADLTRGPDGHFADDDVVKIFKEGVDDCAGAFGAGHVPTVLKAVEVLGIQQARGWNLATLNEFRKFFNLAPHKTFKDINPDQYIADQLKQFYGHPDHVELYPGLIIEKTKEEVVPGSGLCTNFTISRGILSDAVALVRGDRFYTTDWTPRNVTSWGFNEVKYDDNIDFGCVFYKLVLRAFPHHFKQNSIYAHFPLVIPPENQEIMSSLGLGDSYSFDASVRIPDPELTDNHAA